MPLALATFESADKEGALNMDGAQDVKFNNPISDRDATVTVESDPSAQDLGPVPESLDALDDKVEEAKENERAKRRRLAIKQLADSNVIDPDGSFRRKWDLVQMVLLTYVAFGVPYRLGFSHQVLIWTSWFWFDLCVDIYFISDIFISMYTAFWDENGELIVEPADIRRQYLRTWFPVDLSSCFPGNYISCESLTNLLPRRDLSQTLSRLTSSFVPQMRWRAKEAAPHG
jgi:hypothetical protein